MTPTSRNPCDILFSRTVVQAVQEGSECMSRKKKKKSLVMKGAGLAARILLEKRIVKKEQKRASARAEGGRSALQARVKKPVLDEALYHALGGKASNESLKLKAARKALKQKEASAAAVSAKGRKKHGPIRKILRAQALLLGRALVKKKKA